MRYRPVSENGDMRPVYNQEQMLTGTDAVAAAVKSRLELHRGDWWEDETLGLAIPEFLASGIRTEYGCETLLHYLAAYVLKTEGVESLKSSSYVLKNRVLTANIAVQSEFGGTVERRVDLNELLASLS